MLEVAMKTTIKTLYEKGYNKSQIALMLHVDRKTVRKILNESNEGKEVTCKKYPSMFDEYREYLEIQINKDLSVQRIYQDIQKEFGLTCSYSSLRDYVRKIKKKAPKAYMVLNTLPGEEAQVDFGYIGMLKVNGKSHKAWVFVMTLSYSRYMYIQITLDQSVRTFIMCHVNAFRYFGGVPETVKIDYAAEMIIGDAYSKPH